MVFHDMWQALHDVGPVLFLTVFLLGLLFSLGLWLRQHSLKRQIEADRLERYGSDRHHQRATRIEHSASFLEGISTEMFGAVITTLAFGVVVLVFQQYQSIQNRKAELVLQMGSPDNSYAVEALRQLESLGWLYDGTLHEAYLQGANLRGIDVFGPSLKYAILEPSEVILGATCWDWQQHRVCFQDSSLRRSDFQSANLGSSDLQNAILWYAKLNNASFVYANMQNAELAASDLQDADLTEANLQGADFLSANLQGADFSFTNLEGATLIEANLKGANLTGANMKESKIYNTLFDEKTVIPDATWDDMEWQYTPDSYWTPDTDMSRYTDPNHPDFWQPEWARAEREQEQQ